MNALVYAEVRRQPLGISFPHVGPREQIKTARFGSKCLYLPSHLDALQYKILIR